MRNLQAETLRSSKKIIGKKALIGVILAGLLVGCGDVEMEADYPDTYEGATKKPVRFSTISLLVSANNRRPSQKNKPKQIIWRQRLSGVWRLIHFCGGRRWKPFPSCRWPQPTQSVG